MAFIKVDNVAIRGISACVPKNVEENKDLPFYSADEVEHVLDTIGIRRRHVALRNTTAVDLCCCAAEKLLEDLNWDKDSVDVLAFVTQNPDYINQPDSFLVHEKLGFPETTMCLDFFHGCPGWVLGLSSISMMMMTGNCKRILLLDGDTVTKGQYANDREERPLFGDAGTATALEFDKNAPAIYFNIGTKSTDGRALTRLHGAYRNPYTLETLKRELDLRSGASSDMSAVGKMDGMDVFSFAISKAPKSMKKLCSEYSLDVESIDNLVLHQANRLIVENIAKRMSVPLEKVPTSLWEYGNTTSASIPLTMVVARQSELKTKEQKNLVCGFGTGLAWGAAYFETNCIKCPEVILYEE